MAKGSCMHNWLCSQKERKTKKRKNQQIHELQQKNHILKDGIFTKYDISWSDVYDLQFCDKTSRPKTHSSQTEESQCDQKLANEYILTIQIQITTQLGLKTT